jgi:hypothetical protein
MLRIPQCLDNRLIDSGKVASPTHPPHFTPQKHYFFYVSGTHFCKRLSKPQGLVRVNGNKFQFRRNKEIPVELLSSCLEELSSVEMINLLIFLSRVVPPELTSRAFTASSLDEVQTGFVADETVLEQAPLRALRFFRVIIIPPVIHIYLPL